MPGLGITKQRTGETALLGGKPQSLLQYGGRSDSNPVFGVHEVARRSTMAITEGGNSLGKLERTNKSCHVNLSLLWAER